MTAGQYKEIIVLRIKIPNNFKLVKTITAPFNQQVVNIKRYQGESKINYNGSHITIVDDNHGTIHEFSKLITENNYSLPEDKEAQSIAKKIISNFDPQRFQELVFLEIEDQVRYFFDKNGQKNKIPILWIKYKDNDDAFSWVGIAGKGEVVEYERQAYYDYVNGRGKTEQWANDDWLLKHKDLLFSKLK